MPTTTQLDMQVNGFSNQLIIINKLIATNAVVRVEYDHPVEDDETEVAIGEISRAGQMEFIVEDYHDGKSYGIGWDMVQVMKVL